MQRKRIGTCLAAAFGLALSMTAFNVDADGGRVAVGDVSTTIGHANVVPTMKTTLTKELAKVTPPPGKSFIVNASLVKLETRAGSSDTKTSVVVDFAVRDKDGNLTGTVQGTSTMVTKPGEAISESEVVAAAVRGGSRGVADVVAK